MTHKKPAHPVVCFGEALWDYFPEGKEPGGAPMNVAYHLQKLNRDPAVISKIGLDDPGKELITILENKNICTEYFQLDYYVPTGVVKAELKNKAEISYTILENVAWDYIDWEESLRGLMNEASYFLFGSLATRNSHSRETLLKLINLAKIKVLDINLRPPFFNKEMVELLLSNADILKLNLSELELITGWFSPIKNEADRINMLKDRFELKTIIVSKGDQGAILNIGGEFYRHPGYQVEVADTVGSGDAFLAGIISKLIDRSPPEEALDFGCRMGAFVASKRGACPDYNIEELNQINTLMSSKNYND
jgi:fructokinase